MGQTVNVPTLDVLLELLIQMYSVMQVMLQLQSYTLAHLKNADDQEIYAKAIADITNAMKDIRIKVAADFGDINIKLPPNVVPPND